MDNRKVYVYKTTGEKDFSGIACDCHMHQRSGEDWKELWFLEPPDHGHMIQGKVKDETENGFTFRSEGYAPGDWTFKVLTIQDFRRKYSKLVVEGDVIANTIKTTEDLHEWYRKEFKF
jgi:hypothetical protein